MKSLALALILCAAAPLRAAPPNLDGVWLFDVCTTNKADDLMRFWQSVVTVKGDRFTLTKLMGNPNDLTGRLAFDPADPDALDLVLDELDFSPLKIVAKIPAGTYRAKFDAKADRFTIAFARSPADKRPEMLAPSPTTFFATLTRAPAGFKEFPKEITVRVTGPEGKPAAGALVSNFMSKSVDPRKPEVIPTWVQSEPIKTAADGTMKAKFDEPPSVIRDEPAKLIAFVQTSPAKLAGGELRVTLAPECRMTGKVVSPELEKAGGKMEWVNLYLMKDGRRVAFAGTFGGVFDFPVPPGDYSLYAYGEEMPSRIVPVVVPPDRSEFEVAPIELKASALALLKGNPAPEFEEVLGWAGKPVKLADLKGQYVLVDFWGFWCGPCIRHMPTLVELHETFGGKGLAVVGVHMDLDGDVDTAAKLDEKMAHVVKDVWKGKNLPFPSALVSGKRDGPDNTPGGTVRRYAVSGFPTTILIDREGKIVGLFDHSGKDAVAAVEKLLKK